MPALRKRLFCPVVTVETCARSTKINENLIRVGDVVSFDYSATKTGWIAKVVETGFVNPENKYERHIKVQEWKFALKGRTRLILEDKRDDKEPVMQVLQQATKCPRTDKDREYVLEIPRVLDVTYNNRRQLTNPDKIDTYRTILGRLDGCERVLLLESEALSFTKYLKTRYEDAEVDIPNPMADSFEKPKIGGVTLYPMTLQEFAVSDAVCGREYDLVWQDLCKTLKGDNVDILPVLVGRQLVKPGGFLAITCCLRRCDYETSMGIIKKQIRGRYKIVDEKRYWPSMLFVLMKRKSL